MARSIAGVVFLLVVFFSAHATRGADPYEGLSVLRMGGKPAPNFSLPSIGGGKKLGLSDYTGKAVLLGFFKTF